MKPPLRSHADHGEEKKLAPLKKRAQFLLAAKKGGKAAQPGVILQYRLRPPQDDAPPREIRYGLTATRKIGCAVKRNRARRRLRALAKKLLPSHARPGSDYVLIARAATVGRKSAALRDDLLRALKSADKQRKNRQARNV